MKKDGANGRVKVAIRAENYGGRWHHRIQVTATFLYTHTLPLRIELAPVKDPDPECSGTTKTRFHNHRSVGEPLSRTVTFNVILSFSSIAVLDRSITITAGDEWMLITARRCTSNRTAAENRAGIFFRLGEYSCRMKRGKMIARKVSCFLLPGSVRVQSRGDANRLNVVKLQSCSVTKPGARITKRATVCV